MGGGGACCEAPVGAEEAAIAGDDSSWDVWQEGLGGVGKGILRGGRTRRPRVQSCWGALDGFTRP